MSGICVNVNMTLDLDNLSNKHREALAEIVGELAEGKTACSVNEIEAKVSGESNMGKSSPPRKKRKKLVPNKIQAEGSCANEPTLHIEEQKEPVIAMGFPEIPETATFTPAEIKESEELKIPNTTLPPCVEKAIQASIKKNQKPKLSPFELAAQKAAHKTEVAIPSITMTQLTGELKVFMKKKNSVEAVLDVLKKFDANKLSEVKQERYNELHKLLVA